MTPFFDARWWLGRRSATGHGRALDVSRISIFSAEYPILLHENIASLDSMAQDIRRCPHIVITTYNTEGTRKHLNVVSLEVSRKIFSCSHRIVHRQNTM